MTTSTITLNAATTAGDKPLVDTLTTVDGAAAPAGASAQMVKIGHGAASDFKTVSATGPLPTKLTNGTADAGIEPFGALLVNNGYATLFYDSWSVSPIDTTDKWTVTGTSPTIASGNMQMVATLSSYNAIRTKDTVRPNVGFTLVRNGISIETATATGAGRFWGLGTPATTPAAAVLAQDGIGFEIDQATGALLAVTYAAGARTTVATLTRPTDGLNHGYGIYFRVTQAYWMLDGVQVATQSFPNVQMVELPALIVRQNAAAFTGTPAFTSIAHLTADTSRQTMVMADPVIGTRQARVSAAGALSVSGPLGAALALDGTDITTPTAMPAGGVGMRGWLSAIWTKLNGTLAVTGTFFQATQPVSAVSLPLPTGASTETTLAALNTKVTAVNTGAVVLAAGTASIGTAQAPAITKGAQGTTGFTTQDIKDAGRNQIHFYMVIPVLTSATDTLQSLTVTKAGATVVATATPAVVTTGKTLRITRLAASYIATATSGYGIVRLRFNTAGVVAITSPVAAMLTVGAGTANAANSLGSEEATIEEGWEFAAGTGIGVSAQGFAAATATAVGYVIVSGTGYEY